MGMQNGRSFDLPLLNLVASQLLIFDNFKRFSVCDRIAAFTQQIELRSTNCDVGILGSIHVTLYPRR